MSLICHKVVLRLAIVHCLFASDSDKIHNFIIPLFNPWVSRPSYQTFEPLISTSHSYIRANRTNEIEILLGHSYYLLQWIWFLLLLRPCYYPVPATKQTLFTTHAFSRWLITIIYTTYSSLLIPHVIPVLIHIAIRNTNYLHLTLSFPYDFVLLS
jgi:hypothetical protein